MLILELDSFPIEQEPNLDTVESRLGQWFTDHPFPCRIIAYSHRFSMQAATDAITLRQRTMAPIVALATALLPSLRALLAGDPTQSHPADVVNGLSDPVYDALAGICAESLPRILDAPEAASATEWLALGEVLEALTWTHPALADLRHFYAVLAERHLRAATYLMITWEPPTAHTQEIIDSLAYAIGRPVHRRDALRAMLPGPVQADERNARLIPVDPGHPWLAVMRSYAMPAPIDATLLHQVLNGDRDVTLAIDIQPVPHGRAQSLVEMQLNAALLALRTSNAIDPQTAQRAADAERTMAELPTSALHQVQVAVLVTGTDADDLARQTAATRDRLGMALRVEAVAGSQAELLRLFSTTPSTQIDAAWSRSDMLSKGVGCLLGVVGFHRSPATDGWLFGIDGFRQSPVFFEPFAGGRAGHMAYLGVTGFGKTFALNVMTIRAAVLAGHRVIWIDADRNCARLERAIGAGATRHILSPGRTINPLDLVFGVADGPEWLALQITHVIAQLAMIMGTLGIDEHNERALLPRVFTKGEEGYLQRALMMVYAEVGPDAPLTAMPILADAITALEAIDAEEHLHSDGTTGRREARELAETLRKMIYGSRWRTDTQTTLGQSFNGSTTVDWAITDDVVCFDLTEIRQAEELLPLYYAQVIGAVYRYMRDPHRDTRRKTLLVIDEFGLAARIKTIADLGMTISQVARKYGLALVTADQLPNLYLDTPHGKKILGNTRVKVIFHLKEPEARRIATAIPQLTEAHIRFITQPDKGRCVVVYDDIAVPVIVEPTPRELELFKHS